MEQEYFKERIEAEQQRKNGESIYFVAGKGYYVIPSKNNWFEKKTESNLSIMVLSLSCLLLGIVIGVIL